MEEAQRLIESQELMLAQFEERTEDVNRRWEEMIHTMQIVLGSQSNEAHQAQQKLADESGRRTEAFAEQSREMQRTTCCFGSHWSLGPQTSRLPIPLLSVEVMTLLRAFGYQSLPIGRQGIHREKFRISRIWCYRLGP